MPHVTTSPGLLPEPARRLALVLAAGAFLTLVAGSVVASPLPADTIAQRALACAACHGKEGRATSESYFPRIAGKPAGYLYNQLLNFREGRRQYPQMTYMVEHLSDDYLKELAGYFASLNLPYALPEPAAAPAAALERGRALVMQGDRNRGIPACVACHGARLTGVLPAIPSLVGLSHHYLNSQFGAWKSGARKAAPPDCMAEISRRLTPEDISVVTGWLAAQPVPADMHALPSAPLRLPIPCGVVTK